MASLPFATPTMPFGALLCNLLSWSDEKEQGRICQLSMHDPNLDCGRLPILPLFHASTHPFFHSSRLHTRRAATGSSGGNSLRGASR